jgi:hypothetical protein
MFYDFFMTFYLFKSDVNVPSNSNNQKKSENKIFLVNVLKVTDKKSRIRIR